MGNYDLEKIGNFIAKRRKSLGLKQGQLASFINVSPKTVSKWETGHSFPDLAYQVDLCNVLKIDLYELHNGELNKHKRIMNIVFKSIVIFSIILLIIFIPAYIYLNHYYNKTYNTFSISSVEVDDDNFYMNGVFVEYYKYNVLVLNNIIPKIDIDESDMFLFNIYNNDELIYHLNYLTKDGLILSSSLLEKDKISYSFTLNNKETGKGTIIIKKNKIFYIDTALNNISYDNDKTMNILLKHGFKKTGINELIKKDKKNNTEIKYNISEENLYYNYEKDRINWYIIYHLKIDILDSYIYFYNNDKKVLIEKFSYDYTNKRLNCLSNECNNDKEIIKIINEYRSLLLVD